jgi:hypothetical protein
MAPLARETTGRVSGVGSRVAWPLVSAEVLLVAEDTAGARIGGTSQVVFRSAGDQRSGVSGRRCCARTIARRQGLVAVAS